jgi:hypothetical protein
MCSIAELGVAAVVSCGVDIIMKVGIPDLIATIGNRRELWCGSHTDISTRYFVCANVVFAEQLRCE